MVTDGASFIGGHGIKMLVLPTILTNAKRWRMRAEEIRTCASDMVVPSRKEVMEQIAKEYDHWAEIAERACLEESKLRDV